MKPVRLAVAYTLREYSGRTRQNVLKNNNNNNTNNNNNNNNKNPTLHYCIRFPAKQIAWYNRIKLTAIELIIINSKNLRDRST